jgi:hypothetical protein
MPNLKVTLYIRIVTPEGKRKMCKPVYASRGRLKPLYAADAKGNSLGHHPEGEYYLRYAGRTEAVGNDSYVALDRLEERKAELRGSTRADSATSQPQTVERKSARVATLDAAITQYLTTGKAAEKNWRKQAYSQKGVGKDAWEKLLAHTHAGVRERLLETLASFRKVLHLGPHQPLPTAQTPTPISRQDARFALIVAHCQRRRKSDPF